MTVDFWSYLSILHKYIPSELYFVLLGISFVGGFFFLFRYGLHQGSRYFTRLLLLEYISCVYSSTVIFRKTLTTPKYNFVPFWSYFDSHVQLKQAFIMGNIMNMVVFIPLGLLLGFSFEKISAKTVFIIGLALSISIEVLQFALKRGYSEFDDVIHNSIGCMLGFGVSLIIKALYDGISKKREEV